MNVQQTRTDERYATAVNMLVMLAQQAALDGQGEQRDEFLGIAHEFRQKRFQHARHAQLAGSPGEPANVIPFARPHYQFSHGRGTR